MDVLRVRVRIDSLDEPFHLPIFSDAHIGERGCAENRLRAAISKAVDIRPGLVILLGDLGAFIAPDDKRRDFSDVAAGLDIEDFDDWGAVLVAKITALFSPLSGRIICSIEGNHEFGYRQKKQQDVARWIASELGTRALGYNAIIVLTFVAPDGEKAFTIHATHGYGASTTEGGKINRTLKTAENYEEVDLYISGHTHTCQSALIPPRLRAGVGDVEDDRIEGAVIAGSYLRTYSPGRDGYGGRRGYRAGHIGSPVVTVIPRTGEWWVRWLFKRWL